MNLNELNEVQYQAVIYNDGPQLIFAGAGSGKTKVITYKIAYLIEKENLLPWQILALTFTNKAANEMLERVNNLLKSNYSNLWISTFHSFANKILRMEAHNLGYTNNFIIYDEQDRKSAIMTAIKKSGEIIDKEQMKTVIEYISKAKRRLINPENFVDNFENLKFKYTIANIYSEYNNILKKNNAMDFDDLLLNLVLLFQNFPLIKEKYQKKFKYILVDEYQDTNYPQYLIAKSLSEDNRKICVVGDDDQCIYSWRGADIKNILEFEKDFPDAKIFKLEQNYRSNQTILSAATAVVNSNKKRVKKTLWTEKEGGEPISLFAAADEKEEAYFIVNQIYKEVSFNYRKFSDIAVFYRTNAQSRILEQYCRTFHTPIPYNIYGGFRFYDRKEIKDIISYLNLVLNPEDDISFLRIINTPSRGIGKVTIDKVSNLAINNNISILKMINEDNFLNKLSISTTRKQTLKNIAKEIYKLHNIRNNEKISTLLEEIDRIFKISEEYKNNQTIENISRLENIEEFYNFVYEYESKNPDAKLEHFLGEITLYSDVDQMDESEDRINFMTVHLSKGLEFPVVFICGLEDGLFPLYYNLYNEDALEEERRLFYVAITRAKEKVYLSYSQNRRYRDQYYTSTKSRFIDEIPEDLIEEIPFID